MRPGGDRLPAMSETLIAPLPLAALRLAADTIAALSQVGLKRIADVLDRPRAPLAARFGAEFVRRLDQALGREDEPITPRLPLPAALAEQRFRRADRARARRARHDRAARGDGSAHVLERRGEGARLLQAALFRTDGKVFRIEAGTGEPLRDPARIAPPVRRPARRDRRRMRSGLRLRHGAARARSSTERRDPQQTGLAAPDHAAELAHLIDRLGARFGLRRVTRLVPQDTHIPEFAVMAVAAHRAHVRRRSFAAQAGIQRAKNWVHTLSRGRAELAEQTPRPHPPDPPVRAAGADRGGRRSAGRPAGAIHAGGACATTWRTSKARSASRWNGGATRPATR